MTVKDTLPTEVTYVRHAAATNGFSCARDVRYGDAAPGAALAAGQATVITIEVKTVNDGVTSSVLEHGSGRRRLARQDRHRSRQTSGRVDRSGPRAITDTPDPATVGQNVSYTFTVANAGTKRERRVRPHRQMDTSLDGPDVRRCHRLAGLHLRRDRRPTPSPASGDRASGLAVDAPSSSPTRSRLAPPRAHELTVKADSGDVVTESSEANNQQTELTVDHRRAVHLVHRPRGRRDPGTPARSATGGRCLVTTVSNVGDTNRCGTSRSGRDPLESSRGGKSARNPR